MKKEKEIVMIPFVEHESAMDRMERANKRLWILSLIMFIGIMIYFLLPTEIVKEENSQSVNNAKDSEINQNIGE